MFSSQTPKRKHKRINPNHPNASAKKLLPRSDRSCHTSSCGGMNSGKPWARMPQRAFEPMRLACDQLAQSGQTLTLEQYWGLVSLTSSAS